MKKEKTAKTEKNEKHWERVTQEFAPVCDADCRVLILGTAPSKKSREVGFYYGHPQNRFWKMLAAVTGERVPQSIEEKKALLLRNHIALHDVIHSCDIIGSSDSSIRNVEPADFQERIREDFPQYARKQDVLPPQIVNGKPEPQPPVTNYHFLSQDGRWKLNLTKDFIALSTLSYPGWEEFARMLDKPLAAFIQLYKPAYFQRVGLRYLNIVSRTTLDLEDVSWRELFTPAYLGPMAEADLSEDRVVNCACDTQFKLDSSCTAKIHAGIGRLKTNIPNAPQDPEVKFIFDMDLSMGGNTACGLAAAALETLHGHSSRVFEGAITDRLRDAMGR